jgi:hypothetical protein
MAALSSSVHPAAATSGCRGEVQGQDGLRSALPAGKRAVNSSHARIRAVGEQANATVRQLVFAQSCPFSEKPYAGVFFPCEEARKPKDRVPSAATVLL